MKTTKNGTYGCGLSYTVVWKDDGSLHLPALICLTGDREAAERFFGTIGDNGGFNDSRASHRLSFNSRAEALAAVVAVDPESAIFDYA